MRLTNLSAAVLLFASIAFAKTPKAYQSGQISQVNQVSCDAKQNAGPNAKRASVCLEYALESDNIVYTIRARDKKRTQSLEPGQRAEFRFEKETIVLRTEQSGSKEQSFRVISISPTSETSTADVRPVRLNHLQ